MDINQTFSISRSLVSDCKKAGLGDLHMPQTLVELFESIMLERWRIYPMQFDVPSNSQLLGQLIAGNGVHGILYRSTKSNGECLAIYPQNFYSSTCYVELEGSLPEGIKQSRLDSETVSTNT